MKYRFQIDKKNFDVEIPHSVTFHSLTDIRVNQHRLEVLIGENSDSQVFSLFINNKLFRIECLKDEAGYPLGIFVNDEYYPAALVKIDQLFYYKEKPVSASKSGIVKSFIPGTIKKIFFAVNDRVECDDIVLIHEAMKMENEIRAPKAGVIKRLGVQEGDNILANHLLFEIE